MKIALGLILCAAGMFCAVRAIQVSLEIKRMSQVSNNWPDLEDARRNWSIGASAGNLFGAVCLVSALKKARTSQ